MIYKIIQPSSHLQQFVKDYLLLHFVFEKNAPPPVKPFPASTLQCLVFYVKGDVTAYDPSARITTTFPGTAINGSITSRLDFSVSHDCLLLSIAFHPYALSKFLHMPLTEFVNERVDAEAILNPEIHQVREQMANAPGYESIVQIAEKYLWKRIQNLKDDFHPIDNVARLMSENRAGLSVEKMARLACLSTSQFERRFVQLTGITPRLYMRINRFHKAYQLKDQNPGMDWLRIAVESGYHDYQHLAKDFKQFSNVTPPSLLNAQAQSPERILGIA
ncbi:MAG: AraC family transcriptional regulator [Chitinophagaceae bacterium]|nr:AraC family transcriptional regulator [Chitinophagaceae bacterium]